MKIPEIKRLVENFSLEDLILTEKNLLNEEPLLIEVNGIDEGEKLTHIIAAIWSKNQLEENKNFTINEVIRNYTLKIRNTIN
ncbi:MAG: hypothetical protein ACEQSF_04180 [Solirubrobacteraceae bacterium]